jgi:tripartite-type tricarboxylate transporter receptor subunit TctC
MHRPTSALLRAAAIGAALAALPAAAIAQAYPAKPVRVIAGFAPGAPGEFVMRLIQDKVFTASKQPLVIENRVGASGNIGMEMVAKAAPDGYTLFVGPDTVVTVNPHIYRKLGFDPMADLVPVTYLTNTSQTLVCNPSVPVASVTDFINLAKAQKLNYASGGPGVPGHLAMELFMSMTGISMTHVPYKGPGPAMQDVMAGQVPCGFLATAVVVPQAKAGKLKALAVSSANRSAMAPEIATAREAGVAGYDATFGEILLAPKGTPPAIIQQWRDEVAKAFQDPAVRERMIAIDLPPVANTPAEAQARARSESARWAKVVEQVKLQVD